jgi:MoaA/NifB/PqqE/SkfB family radical SAM enzyme
MNYPKEISIETSSVCDLRCVMCPQSAKVFGRPKIFLSDDVIDKMIPFIQNATHLQLHGIGEPLLSPSFWKILEIVTPECFTAVNTNLVNVSGNKLLKLVASNLTHISVSIDSPNVDTYYKIRGTDLNRVIKNIKRLMSIITASESKMFVTLNMTLMRENIEQINQALDLCSELGCYGVDTWPLNNSESEDLNRESYGWKFTYADQLPWKFKELYNEKLQLAVEYAKKLDKRFVHHFI